MSSFELFLAWRYFRSRSHRANEGKGFVSFVSVVAIGGIALGVMALIVVVSVMNGFQREVRHNILGVVSHAFVESRFSGGQSQSLDDWQSAFTDIKIHARTLNKGKGITIEAMAPYIERQGLITHRHAVKGVAVRGINPALEPQVADFTKTLITGSIDLLTAGSFRALIGTDMARQLGLRVGDSLTLIAPQAHFTPVGALPRMRRFEVAGLFRSGLNEYDAGLVLIGLEDAATLYQTANTVDGIRLRFDDVLKAPEYVQGLNRYFLDKHINYFAQDWSASHANFFRAVQIEKRMMFLILSIIIAVAAFNIVNQQMMLIGEKQGDIAILRTLGASKQSVVCTFLWQGLLLGFFGVLIGVMAGIVVALNVEAIVSTVESMLRIKILSPEVYQITELPSELIASDVVMTALLACAITIIATLYPSLKAAQVEPAKALRHE